MRKPKSFIKGKILERWAGMKRKRKLHMRIVHNDHTGSTFDQDTIRITGTLKFIDAWLSRMTELLDYENGQSYLKVSLTESVDKETKRPLGTWVCYIYAKERGNDALIVNTAFGLGSPYDRELGRLK